MATDGRSCEERRQYSRYAAVEGLFLAFRPDFQKIGRISDVSQGGVAVEYTSENRLDPATMVEVDIFTSPRGIHLSRVPCQIVYDYQLRDMPSLMGLETRRCGLRFKHLNEDQFRQIGTLLGQCTIQGRESEGPLRAH